MFHRLLRIADFISITIVTVVLATGSVPRLDGQTDRVRAFTRGIEFDYPSWVWDASWLKVEQNAIGLPYLFDRETNKQIVFEYLRTTQRLMEVEAALERVFADPAITDKESKSALLRAQQAELLKRQEALAPLAEAAFQTQITEALAELNLTTSGQPIPPVLYHTTPTPLALIVSRRDVIQQVANISVAPTLTLDDQIALENRVAASLDVSTLTVPIGGVGVYPTMITETTNLPWLLDTIAHEWTHNYLNLRPLGINYSATPETRTMNETTASIAGNEIGTYVIQKYFPELALTQPTETASSRRDDWVAFGFLPLPSSGFNEDPPFDFRAEMHETRVTADQLLAEGKIEEAESYMEERRQVFWQNGYLLRKLNQAYFAFHGAYADVPGGAAGEDPVGPAVRALRAQSASLADFINKISLMTSFDELKEALR
ncbi:MAG: hypothetical protein IT314_00115 [Anaerolineales bacterium]|nr:hypothetical protein [Anaerolineales bacterium]